MKKIKKIKKNEWCDYGHFKGNNKKCKECEKIIKECMVNYKEQWKDIVETKGKFSVNNNCKEGYADYIIGMCYISIHDVSLTNDNPMFQEKMFK